jgi:hypothetical protein
MRLAVALDDTNEIPALRSELAGITLTPAERRRVDEALRDIDDANAFEQSPG